MNLVKIFGIICVLVSPVIIVDQKISAPPKSFLAHEYLPVSITHICKVGAASAVRTDLNS